MEMNLRSLRHAWRAFVAGAAICACGLSPVSSQETKKSEKPEIPGGIEGHVKSVDHGKETLSIIASTGRERTFKVTEETTMVGPRGGKVRRRLNDKRFHPGMELTVVPDGNTAAQIHLGFSRRQPGDSADVASASKSKPTPSRGAVAQQTTAGVAKKTESTKLGKMAKAAPADEGDDEDDEILGKVKSFEPEHRVLVVTLLNGKTRSFFLANDVKLMVKGTPSKQGLKDPAIKDGAVISVFVEAGGRRVRELHITPATAGRSKKAA